MNISDVTKILDIAALRDMSAIKSEDGLVYICGNLFNQRIKKFTICEYTNIFDICNSVTAQSPISTNHVYTNEEFFILNDLEAAFNDHVSLMLHSSYFFTLSFQLIEDLLEVANKRFVEDSYTSELFTSILLFILFFTDF